MGIFAVPITLIRPKVGLTGLRHGNGGVNAGLTDFQNRMKARLLMVRHGDHVKSSHLSSSVYLSMM